MPSFARGSAVLLFFTRNDDPFFDCDCDCDCSAERRRSAEIIESCHFANYFVCDALHDSILPFAAGMNATTAALPSVVVVAVSSWWGWHHRTVCGQQSLAGHCSGLLVVCVEVFYFFSYCFFLAAPRAQCASSISVVMFG